MSKNLEETDPGLSAKAHKAALKAQEAARKVTEKTDPWADRMLESAKASAYTPWLIVGAVVLCIILGVIVSR